MRKNLFILLLLLPLSIFAYNTDDGYKINSWIYEATIHKNNVWDVKETMNVTFLEERHGIYKYIPRIFTINNLKEENGEITYKNYKYYTELSDINVDSYEFETSGTGDYQDNLLIKIGDAEKTLTGEHTYVIRYKMTVPDDRCTFNDYIYVTVLGTDWNTTTDRFAFMLKFDKPLPENTAKDLNVYYGYWGNDDQNSKVHVEVGKSTISGYADSIQAHDGITLKVDLPDGYWENPYRVSTSLFYVFGGITALIFCFIMWYFITNKQEKPIVVVEYEAPEGISSAEVGTIIDNSADLKDLTSLIVWFASKGYIKINETRDGKNKLYSSDDYDIEVEKIKELPKKAPSYQKTFWKVLFEKGNKVRLDKLGDRHELINTALNELNSCFQGEKRLRYFNTNIILAIIAFFICGTIAFANSGVVTGIDEDMLLFGFIVWSGPALTAIGLRIYFSNYDLIVSKTELYAQFVILFIAGGIGTYILYCLYIEENYGVPFEYLVCLTVAGWVIALFSARVEKDTPYRLEKMSLLLGLKEFIELSEMPMLKALVDETPSLFYDVLPYAIVFDLSDKWVEKFKEIDLGKPEWYSTRLNTSAFEIANRLSTNTTTKMSKSISISSHNPSSGGSFGGSSGGGGYSGGGCGGGGGGSW